MSVFILFWVIFGRNSPFYDRLDRWRTKWVNFENFVYYEVWIMNFWLMTYCYVATRIIKSNFVFDKTPYWWVGSPFELMKSKALTVQLIIYKGYVGCVVKIRDEFSSRHDFIALFTKRNRRLFGLKVKSKRKEITMSQRVMSRW